MPDLIPLPFAEAIAWARTRQVVLPEVYYGQLQGLARAQAFTIAGLTSLDQLQAVADSLTRVLESGATFRDWQKRVRSGEVPLELSSAQLETIFRNNIQQSYNRGRYEQQAANLATHPYYMYDAVNDSRTRPSHAAMDGFVAPADDPVWQTWTPACGHRCRCRRIALSERQAARYREQDAARLADPEFRAERDSAKIHGPDKGWEHDVYGDPMAGLKKAVERRAETAEPRLMAEYRRVSASVLDALSAPLPVVVSGAPTLAFVAAMQSVIDGMPPVARQVLRAGGVEAHVTDSLISAFPSLKGAQPRGWPSGSTWDNADGICGGWVKPTVAERYQDMWNNNAWTTSRRSKYVLGHESGHAYDHAAGYPSASPSFRDAYAKGLAADPRFPDGTSAIDSYFTQPGDAGPQEAFAHLFVHAILGHGDQNMPNAFRWVRAMLGLGGVTP